MNRKRFFDAVRLRLFGGTLTQGQVDGISAILDEWDLRKLVDNRWLAYILATPYIETNRTMQPIDEIGGHAYFTRLYDVTGDYPERAIAMGNVHPGDGARYHGRGLVQLTWFRNYFKMTSLLGARFGISLTDNPDDAKRMDVAVAIMFEGMLRADSHVGDFTGVSLENYFNETKDDPFNARRVINGLDRAQEIADLYKIFLEAIIEGERDVVVC